eukprot:5852847-Pleurochrysis_carterae.AAC.1
MLIVKQSREKAQPHSKCIAETYTLSHRLYIRVRILVAFTVFFSSIVTYAFAALTFSAIDMAHTTFAMWLH